MRQLALGLFAAAGDTVTDVAAVLLSLFAVRLARRTPTAQRSFGYHRSTILAAQAKRWTSNGSRRPRPDRTE